MKLLVRSLNLSLDANPRCRLRLNLSLRLLLLCLALLATFPPPTLADSQDYSMGAEDVLKISVWDHPDLSQEEAVVSMEGYISFPLIGQVKVQGLTTSQLEQRLCQLLGDGYIVNPQVRVTVVKYRSKLIHVLGEVKSPGALPLTRNEISLMEAISMVQGVTQDAGREAIIVRPQKPKSIGNPHPIETASKEELITANLTGLLEGNLKENLILRSGDTIYVPRMRYFYIMGEVVRPGRYVLEKDTTIRKAIGLAGGLTASGAQNKIKILKEKEGKKEEMPAKVEDLVQPEDTIVIPRGNHFFITGEVNNPGRYPMEESMTVMQAISVGGGLTAKGSPRRIRIIRMRDGRETKLSASLSDRVEPEDTIVVLERIF